LNKHSTSGKDTLLFILDFSTELLPTFGSSTQFFFRTNPFGLWNISEYQRKVVPVEQRQYAAPVVLRDELNLWHQSVAVWLNVALHGSSQ